MRIATKCKLALAALLEVAAYSSNDYKVSLPVICKKLSISRSYLEQIFSNLKSAGLILGRRGPGGGYSLAKNPDLISLKDIVDAFEDSRPKENCHGAQLWSNLDEYIHNRMSQILLSQIMESNPIQIETVSKPFSLKCDKTRVSKASNASKASKALEEQALRIASQSIGPNSIFTFGKHLLKNNGLQ